MAANPALLTGLTAASIDLQDWPRVFIEVVEGGPTASPEVRGDDRTIPYRRGQTYMPKRADRLSIRLRGWITGQGASLDEQLADAAAARAELSTLFNVEGGPLELSVTTEDGTVWTASAYPQVFLPEFEPVSPLHQGVSVRLLAIDPPEWIPDGS